MGMGDEILAKLLAREREREAERRRLAREAERARQAQRIADRARRKMPFREADRERRAA